MGRKETGFHDYPKKDNFSLSAISWDMFGISYQETTDAQMRKIKRKYGELNK